MRTLIKPNKFNLQNRMNTDRNLITVNTERTNCSDDEDPYPSDHYQNPKTNLDSTKEKKQYKQQTITDHLSDSKLDKGPQVSISPSKTYHQEKTQLSFGPPVTTDLDIQPSSKKGFRFSLKHISNFDEEQDAPGQITRPEMLICPPSEDHDHKQIEESYKNGQTQKKSEKNNNLNFSQPPEGPPEPPKSTEQPQEETQDIEDKELSKPRSFHKINKFKQQRIENYIVTLKYSYITNILIILLLIICIFCNINPINLLPVLILQELKVLANVNRI